MHSSQSHNYIIVEQQFMTTRTFLYIIRSALVLIFGLFTFVFGFDCLQEFRFYFIPCFFATLAINLCLLFRVKFSPRKIEKFLAAAYLILFAVSFVFLYIMTGFALFNWSANANEWDVARVSISVLFTDYCIVWLAVCCAVFLIRGRSHLIKDSMRGSFYPPNDNLRSESECVNDDIEQQDGGSDELQAGAEEKAEEGAEG